MGFGCSKEPHAMHASAFVCFSSCLELAPIAMVCSQSCWLQHQLVHIMNIPKNILLSAARQLQLCSTGRLRQQARLNSNLPVSHHAKPSTIEQWIAAASIWATHLPYTSVQSNIPDHHPVALAPFLFTLPGETCLKSFILTC